MLKGVPNKRMLFSMTIPDELQKSGLILN